MHVNGQNSKCKSGHGLTNVSDSLLQAMGEVVNLLNEGEANEQSHINEIWPFMATLSVCMKECSCNVAINKMDFTDKAGPIACTIKCIMYLTVKYVLKSMCE